MRDNIEKDVLRERGMQMDLIVAILFWAVVWMVLRKPVKKLIRWLKEPIVYKIYLSDDWEIKKKK